MPRIIAGTAKNLQLQTPEVGTRPITDMAKSALFSILIDWMENSDVLDLYAGSGSLGIEALSRNAKSATFVDKSENSIRCIKNNLEKAKLENNAQVIKSSAGNFISKSEIKLFDIIFLDPPYNETNSSQIIEASKYLKDDGIIVLKHAPQFKPDQEVTNLQLIETRKYGNNHLSFFKR